MHRHDSHGALGACVHSGKHYGMYAKHHTTYLIFFFGMSANGVFSLYATWDFFFCRASTHHKTSRIPCQSIRLSTPLSLRVASKRTTDIQAKKSDQKSTEAYGISPFFFFSFAVIPSTRFTSSFSLKGVLSSVIFVLV